MKELPLIGIVVLLLVVTACSMSDSRNANSVTRPALSVRSRDMEISDSADRSLRAQGLEGIKLDVNDGQVTLRGQVDTESQKRIAEETVKNTPGVMGVSNEITVQNKPPVNTNKPGGPQKNGNLNTNKPGGPSRSGKT